MAPELIVAIADNYAIGRGGDIPWHLSADLKHFKAVTMGHPVIMGRRTFESIGRVLPGRLNIIVSSTLGADDARLAGKDARVVSSLAEALAVNTEAAPMVIGGARLYREALQVCAVLHLTRVHLSVEDADTFFPRFDGMGFERRELESHCDGGIAYDFETWVRA